MSSTDPSHNITQFIHQYELMSQWHHSHQCTIILITGTYGCEKHVIGARLANKLNITNTIHTNTIVSMNTKHNSALPLYLHQYNDINQLYAAQQDISMAVFQHLSGELSKCLQDRRTLILVGTHIDPLLYQQWANSIQHNNHIQPNILTYICSCNQSAHMLNIHNKLMRHNSIYHNDASSNQCECNSTNVMNNIQSVNQWFVDKSNHAVSPYYIQSYTVSSVNNTVQSIHSDIMKHIVDDRQSNT